MITSEASLYKTELDSAGIYFRRGAYWFRWTEALACLYTGQFPRVGPSFAPIAEHSLRYTFSAFQE